MADAGWMRLNANVAWCTVDDQVVATDLRTTKYVAVNGSGAALWAALVEGASEEQLRRELVDRFGISDARARRDVSAFVESLRERDLLSA